MITTRILDKVLHIGVNNDIGSAFVIDYNKENFIITAKHVIDSLDFENSDLINIKIFNNEKWIECSCSVYIHDNPEIDIAVLKLSQKSFYLPDIIIGMNNLVLGTEVYFLGFPYGMLMDSSGISQSNGYPIPFVKKGIISAIISKYDVTSIYLDAHNNTGFSGGPVINFIGSSPQIIGVNVSYIKHDNELTYEEQDDDGKLYEEKMEYHENSGIMEVQGINHVFEILEQNNF